MPPLRKYPQELWDRAVRLVYEARKEDPDLSLNAAVVRVGQRTGPREVDEFAICAGGDGRG